MAEKNRSQEPGDCWLAVNTGSSSLKVGAFDAAGQRFFSRQVDGLAEKPEKEAGRGHNDALRDIIDAFDSERSGRLRAVAHRVVHGGDLFYRPTRIDADMLARLRSLDHLAPLHNPLATTCIEVARQCIPDRPQYALFDTALHHDMPPESRDYALPTWCRDRLGIRRYGFHGLSTAHAIHQIASALGRPAGRLNLIVAHLGNGASLTAIRGGRSVATSMGMTPLEGLVMGTRAGDIDPAIPGFLQRHADLSADEVDHLLNHESGLTGLCGTRDLREIHAAIDRGDERASEALSMFVHRIRHYLGGYLVNLGRLDALVFTGGVGENDAIVRASVCEGLSALGLAISPAANQGDGDGIRAIHQPHSPAGIWIVPADEEREMVRQLQAAD